MTQQLEKTWAGKVLNAEQLKEYAVFESNLKNRFTDSDRKTFENNWTSLLAEIAQNLQQDPRSAIGVTLAQRCMELINSFYGQQHAELRHNIWQNG